MSKDHKKTKKNIVENVDNLKEYSESLKDLQMIQDSYELINSVIDIIKSRNLNTVYPFTLIIKALEIASKNIREVCL